MLKESPDFHAESVQFDADPKDYIDTWLEDIYLAVISLGVLLPRALARLRCYYFRRTQLLGYRLDYQPDWRVGQVAWWSKCICAVIGIGAFIEYQWQSWPILFLLLPLLALSSGLHQWHRLESVEWPWNFQVHPLSASETIEVIFIWPLLEYLSLGLLLPIGQGRRIQIAIGSLSLNDQSIPVQKGIGKWMPSYGMLVAATTAVLLTVAVTWFSLEAFSSQTHPWVPVIAATLIAGLGWSIIRGIWFASRWNLLSDMLDSDLIRLEGRISPKKAVLIHLKSAILTVLSLGVYWPRGQIQKHQLLCDSLQLHWSGGLSQSKLNAA